MNYFELYGFPVGFTIDEGQLKKKYYELSRMYHPDFFTQSDPAKQAEALAMSAQVNKGYKTFQDPDATIQYLLELKGIVEPEEKYKLDPVFLGEVMEINEEMMELEMEPDEQRQKKLEAATDTLSKNIYHEVEQVLAGYKEGVGTEKELLRVKEYYYRKKYLQRILAKLASLRNIATRK